MSDSDELYDAGFAGHNQVDPSQSLTGDNTDDPLDAGYSPPDREPHHLRDARTTDDERAGKTLDEKLREEESEVGEQDIVAADADPRAGRLVAPDEGAHPDEEKDEIATDVGRAGYAASAEEAAVHVEDEGRQER
ncbi:MAG TPA: DUF5709 domain-containing protein [Jatrophihabitantaceae bacterium]|nr:DUF5709 domain-containing protein [Jatrophihabitantaceae bacterium]